MIIKFENLKITASHRCFNDNETSGVSHVEMQQCAYNNGVFFNYEVNDKPYDELMKHYVNPYVNQTIHVTLHVNDDQSSEDTISIFDFEVDKFNSVTIIMSDKTCKAHFEIKAPLSKFSTEELKTLKVGERVSIDIQYDDVD